MSIRKTVTGMGTSIEKCREVAGNEYNECGNCSHFTLTDDVIGKCGIPLPGIVNTVWMICKTSKMRCKLYDRIERTPTQSYRDDPTILEDGA